MVVTCGAQLVAEKLQEDHVPIHPWQQFVHTLRTEVTSWHHNVSARLSAQLAETFGATWRPTSETVWLLGRRYEEEAGAPPLVLGPEEDAAPRDADHCPAAASTRSADGGPQEFHSSWAQIMRMTYRKGFAPMYRCVRNGAPGTDEKAQYIRLTSDAGWGCMIRVGQMLLATALKRHAGANSFTGSDTEGGAGGAHTSVAEADTMPSLEQQFLDDPCPQRSPFSIFGFIRASYGKETTQKSPGDWFGPTTISETIAALVRGNAEHAGNLAVYIDPDGVLYEDEVQALAREEQPYSHPLQSASRRSYSPRATVARSGDSEDEDFMVLCSDSVSLASARSPLMVPPDAPQSRTSAAQAEASPRQRNVATSVGSSRLWVASAVEAAEEAGATSPGSSSLFSFREIQAGSTGELELTELQLPPAAVDIERGAADSTFGGLNPSPSSVAGSPTDAGRPRPAGSDSGAPAGDAWRRAVLLLFPLKLGLGKYVSDAHASSVLRYFELRASLGAMGGRPRMAHYFVGCQGTGLLYVDPHVVQPAAVPGGSNSAVNDPANETGSSGTETFRNSPTVQIIPVDHIDSSISFAFYCRSEADLAELLEGIRTIADSEVNPLIRAEARRPEALQIPQADRIESLCCDLDEIFPEAARHDLWELGEGTVVDAAGETSAPEASDDSGASEAPMSAAAVKPGRILCVGLPWADGQWAQVNSLDDSEVNAQAW